SARFGSSPTIRMRPSFSAMTAPRAFMFLAFRQREIKRHAFVDRTLGAPLAAMPMDDALNGREADSRAFELFREVQALEHAEQLVDMLHVESGAVVPHEYLHLADVVAHAADLDYSRAAVASEFDGVRE